MLQFLVMITLIFILELTVGILAFVYSSKVRCACAHFKVSFYQTV